MDARLEVSEYWQRLQGIVDVDGANNTVAEVVSRRVDELASCVGRLERNIEHGTLLEMVASLAEENRRLSADNEKLRSEIRQAQQEKAELAKGLAALAEKVANTALAKLEAGGSCV